LRETRIVHWNLVTRGKLNERRYKNILKKSLKMFKESNALPNWLFVLFQLFNRIVSWNHMLLIFEYKLFIINGSSVFRTPPKTGDIFEVVTGLGSTFFLKWYSLNTKKYVNRVKRWSYLNYCRYYNKSLKKKKSLPKIIKKLPISFNVFEKSLFIDYSLGVVIIGKNLSCSKSVDGKKIYVSTVTKLYNWRYSA
jgi:hypothetical protein